MSEPTPEQTIAELEASVRYYIAKAERSAEFAAEQRARRLAVEEELDLLSRETATRDPLIRYIERKVYKPMPPKIIRGPIKYIDRFVDRPVDRTVKVEVPVLRPPGFFGRMGDMIDRLVKP